MNRRIICLLLVLVLCVSLTACRMDPQKEPSNPTVEMDPSVESGTAATNGAAEETNSGAADSTGNSTNETINTPATQQTVPPEADASVGVVKGEGGSDLDGDTQDAPATSSPPENTTATKPNDNTSQIGSDFDLSKLTYEDYNAMSGEDQRKVIAMFGSTDDFIRWYKAMEAKYKAEHPDIEIGDGNVNAEDIIN